MLQFHRVHDNRTALLAFNEGTASAVNTHFKAGLAESLGPIPYDRPEW